jgi:hypothetical protein
MRGLGPLYKNEERKGKEYRNRRGGKNNYKMVL